ncbi:MAG: hypothetical protein JRK53_01425 [Deltaproteobacteria bacterium]|nr:hypothetical protein [Deltaproteobacteria bacterium]
MRPRSFRFGVICRGLRLRAWEAASLNRLLRVNDAALALLLIDKHPDREHSGHHDISIPGSRRAILWRFYRSMSDRKCPACRMMDPTPQLVNVPRVACPVPGTYSNGQVSSTIRDLQEIQEHRLDFILDLGPGAVWEKMLDIPRYGVWAFQFGDDRKYAGDTSCFWEVYHNDTVTVATLKRLTGASGKGVILRKGVFRTIPTSYTRNREAVYCNVSEWPAQVCTDLINGNARYVAGTHAGPFRKTFRQPTNARMALVPFRLAAASCRFVIRFLLFKDQWNMGIIDEPITALMRSQTIKVRWVRHPLQDRYMADPFAVFRNGHLLVAFEDYLSRDRRGTIATALIKGTGLSAIRTVIEDTCHMSYPFLLEHEGQLYCIPETGEAGEVALYRAEEFPRRWVKEAILITGYGGIDSTVIQHDDRWWMFGTDAAEGPDCKLNIWYSDELFGPWRPHAKNPVKVDVRSSRPAGTPFIHEGRLIRPAQDCSESYGRRIVLNRVKKLTPREFEEEAMGVIEPMAQSPYPDGVHTLSAAGNRTIVDGKKTRLVRTRADVMDNVRLLTQIARRKMVKNCAGGAIEP